MSVSSSFSSGEQNKRSSGGNGGGKRSGKGSKKTQNDAMHLLNWHYESHVIEEEVTSSHHQFRPRKHNRYAVSSFKQSIFKLAVVPIKGFVNERCLWDVDAIIPWSLVVFCTVLKSEGFEATCPICLDTLQIPRITECGHIFCYTCILRYILSCDKSAPRCPVCSKQVCQPDMKFVKISDCERLAVDRPCTLQLCCLRNGSIYPSPVGGAHAVCNSSLGHHHLHGQSHPHQHSNSDFEDLTGSSLPFFSSDSAKFSRISVASMEDVRSIFAEERAQLLSYQSDCLLSSTHGVYSGIRGDVEHLPFITFALEYSAERESQLIMQIQQCLSSSVAGGGVGAMATASTKFAKFTSSVACGPPGTSVTTPETLSTTTDSQSMQSTAVTTTSVTTHPAYTYYYQLGDGENVFLHPLCLRILLAAAEDKARTARIRADSSSSLDAPPETGPGRRGRSDSSDVSLHEWSERNDGSSSTVSGEDTANPATGSVSKGSSARRRRSSGHVHLDSSLTATVVELEVAKVTNENRQRTPFLRHLSLGTVITLVEVDLKPLVTAHILNKFRDELNVRDKKRKQRLQQKLHELEMDEEAKLVHEAYVQSVRHMQMQQQADLARELTNAPRLGACSDDPADDNNAIVVDNADDRAGSPAKQAPGDRTKSFASITQMSGYFPVMGSHPAASSIRQIQASEQSAAWGGVKRATNSVRPEDRGASSSSASAALTWASVSASSQRVPRSKQDAARNLTTSMPAPASAGAARETVSLDEDLEQLQLSPSADERKTLNRNKKGKGKNKGVSLFSNSGSRSYRA